MMGPVIKRSHGSHRGAASRARRWAIAVIVVAGAILLAFTSAQAVEIRAGKLQFKGTRAPLTGMQVPTVSVKADKIQFTGTRAPLAGGALPSGPIEVRAPAPGIAFTGTKSM